MIRQALDDTDQSVRTAAVEGLRGLHFPHAFNPLTRIYRESEEPLVRAVALESVGTAVPLATNPDARRGYPPRILRM